VKGKERGKHCKIYPRPSNSKWNPEGKQQRTRKQKYYAQKVINK